MLNSMILATSPLMSLLLGLDFVPRPATMNMKGILLSVSLAAEIRRLTCKKVPTTRKGRRPILSRKKMVMKHPTKESACRTMLYVNACSPRPTRV